MGVNLERHGQPRVSEDELRIAGRDAKLLEQGRGGLPQMVHFDGSYMGVGADAAEGADKVASANLPGKPGASRTRRRDIPAIPDRATCYVALGRAYADLVTGACSVQVAREALGQWRPQAVAAYQQSSDMPHDVADRVISQFSDQLVRLAKQPWFIQSAAQELIIAECVRWLEGTPAAETIHQLWERWWVMKRGGFSKWLANTRTDAEQDMWFEFWVTELNDAEDKWLAAWLEYLVSQGIAGI
jgi:hypothetical protein